MVTPVLRQQAILFNGYTLPTPMKSTTTQTAGTPANTMTSGGYIAMSLDATAEVQAARLDFGNVLSYPIDKIDSIEWWAKCSASLAAAVSLFMGVGSAASNTIGSIAQRAMFKMTGGGLITCDAVDGTNSQTGVATGLSFPSTDWTKFSLEFKQGCITIGPPANNVGGVGGKYHIIFKMENAQGKLRQVGQRTQFNMGAYSGNLQPIFCIVKSANAATGELDIRDLVVNYRL